MPPSAEAAPYEVGHSKPPVASQFKPGRSGNPKGRPKGAQTKRPALNEERLRTIIIDEAYRDIKVNDGKRQVTVSMAQAVFRSIAVNAARGQHRSQRLFAELVAETERANKALSDEMLQTAIEYKQHWEAELERRENLGIIRPDPLPHPDDILIDSKTGQVTFKGPVTKEEKAEWDRLYDRVEESDREIAEMTASLKDRKNRRFRAFIEDDIAHERKIRNIIVKAIGEPSSRRDRRPTTAAVPRAQI